MESPHFTLDEVVPGVFAAVAGSSGAAVSNAAIIDLGDRTLIVDTFMTVPAAEDLRAAAEELTGRSASLVVTSHWHDDHTGGNQVFDDASIVSTARTIELIAGTAPDDLDAYAAEIDQALDAVRKSLETAESEAERQLAESRLRMYGAVKESLPGFRLTLPTAMADDGMTVEGSGRSAEVLTYGGGHTDSDVFVHLPSDGVIACGDLLWVECHPRVNDGYPAEWAAMLDTMSGLHVEHLVPGHGPVGDRTHLAAMASYLRAFDELVDQAVLDGTPDADLASIPPPAGSEAWTRPYMFEGSLAALAARRRDT
jgi:glyoxylase-like metal-dependent hydrolase (beta-lactamase superfamily II)